MSKKNEAIHLNHLFKHEAQNLKLRRFTKGEGRGPDRKRRDTNKSEVLSPKYPNMFHF